MSDKKFYQRKIIKWWKQELPPFGFPIILAEQTITTEKKCGAVKFPELDDLYLNKKPPRGYAIYWEVCKEPPKTKSDEFRAKIRIRKMKERIYKNYPLFADEFIEKELAEKEDYFSGKLTDVQIEAINEVKADYIESIQNAQDSNSNLVIHAKWWEFNNSTDTAKFEMVV